MAPPTQETIERLQAADGGYGRNTALRALLESGGDETSALALLRNAPTYDGQVAATVVGMLAAAEPSTVVEATLFIPPPSQPATTRRTKTLTEKLAELNEAKENKLISEQEFQVGC